MVCHTKQQAATLCGGGGGGGGGCVHRSDQSQSAFERTESTNDYEYTACTLSSSHSRVYVRVDVFNYTCIRACIWLVCRTLLSAAVFDGNEMTEGKREARKEHQTAI